MGWIGLHREKGQSHKQFFESEWPSIEILDTATKGGVVYMAARKRENPAEVFALVIPFQWTRDHFNFTYKDQDETQGPCDVECPDRILDLLTPTDYHYANEWRAKCRAFNAAQAAKPNVKPGDEIEFAEPLHFNDGRKMAGPFRFVKRSTFTFFGRAYNLGRDWKRRDYRVVTRVTA